MTEQTGSENCAQMGALEDAHKRFEPFVGTFKAEVKMWMGPGEPHVSTGVMINTLDLGGRFLKQVSLVDEVKQEGDQIHATLIPLGAERLQVQWIDPQGRVREDLEGRTDWKPGPQDRGRWKLRVQFVSSEVQDPDQEDYTVQTVRFEIT